MGSAGPLDRTFPHLTGGLVKPARLLKKVAATLAAGLIVFGAIAGTATAASANSGEITRSAPVEYSAGGNSGEITRGAPGAEFTALGGNSGEIT
jgi:hypothetical protein